MEKISKLNSLNKLSTEITNLIDSNKTITRPSHVVKELIENSLDANSTNITIIIKSGGLSLIQIIDNGSGIHKSNFQKLCNRFNSSKMSSYDEIHNIQTFGFRGEALSILSYISFITITSRTIENQHAFEAVFQNGMIVGRDGSSDGKLNIVNGEIGTNIKIENLFYNNQVRKNSYDNTTEFSEILNLVQNYSIHFSKVNFILRNVDNRDNAFSTIPIVSSFQRNIKFDLSESEIVNRKALISSIFNKEIINNLSIFRTRLDLINIEFECWCSKPSTNLKVTQMIVFINNRLVNNNKIKKLFDMTYSKFLIKNGHYFTYISLKVDPKEIDINVKGNKNEVYFTHEDSFLEELKILLENQLNTEINSKNYYVGEYSAKNFTSNSQDKYDISKENEKLQAKEKVRVDSKMLTIEGFLKNQKFTQNIDEIDENIITENDVLKCLLDNYFSNFNQKATEIMKNSVYVGIDDLNMSLFIQYQTSLFIINYSFLIQEFIIFKIVNNSYFILEVELDLSLLDIIDYVSEQTKCDRLSQNEINIYCQLISENKEIFDIIGITINENYVFQTIPFILKDIFSEDELSKFSEYLAFTMYSVVEYLYYDKSDKKVDCLFEIIKIFSFYMRKFWLDEDILKDKENLFKNIILTEIKKSNFIVRKSINEEFFLEKIVDTESLYSIFERC